jgi:hypothetical protein
LFSMPDLSAKDGSRVGKKTVLPGKEWVWTGFGNSKAYINSARSSP